MLMHARGLQPENLVQVLTFSTPPDLQEQLFDDLLNKRNRRPTLTSSSKHRCFKDQTALLRLREIRLFLCRRKSTLRVSL